MAVGRHGALVVLGALLALAGCGGSDHASLPRIYTLPVQIASLPDGRTAYLVVDPGEDDEFSGPLTGRLDIYPPPGADPGRSKPEHFDLSGEESASNHLRLTVDALLRDGTDTTYTLTGEHEADGDMRLVLASADPTLETEPIPLSFHELNCAEGAGGPGCEGTSAISALERPLFLLDIIGEEQTKANLHFEFSPREDQFPLEGTFYSFTTWSKWKGFKGVLQFKFVTQFDGDRLADGRYTEAYISWWHGANWAWVDHWVDGEVRVKYDIPWRRGFDLQNAELVYIRPDGHEFHEVGLIRPGYHRATNYSIDRSYSLSD